MHVKMKQTNVEVKHTGAGQPKGMSGTIMHEDSQTMDPL